MQSKLDQYNVAQFKPAVIEHNFQFILVPIHSKNIYKYLK